MLRPSLSRRNFNAQTLQFQIFEGVMGDPPEYIESFRRVTAGEPVAHEDDISVVEFV